MDNVTSLTTQVNNIPSLYEPNLNVFGRPRSYSGERSRHLKADQLCDTHKFKPTIRTLLHELIKLSNAACEVFHGHESLASILQVSASTIKRSLSRLISFQIISSERRGNTWADKATNKTTLLFLQHELPPVEVKMTNDINNITSLRDLTNKQTYDEYAFASPKVEKKKPKAKSKHINASALNGDDPDGEVIRVCLAWMLTEELTKAAVMKMRDRKTIGNPVKYLAGMMKIMSSGNWEVEKEEPQRLPIEQRRAIESELRAKAEVMAFASLAQKGMVEPTVYDPFSPWHAHYSTEVAVIFNQLCKEHGALNNAN